MEDSSSLLLIPRGWLEGQLPRGVIDAFPSLMALQSVLGMSSSTMVADPTSNSIPLEGTSSMSEALLYHLAPNETVEMEPFHFSGRFTFRNMSP